jgi:hypothetical protein
MCVYSQHYRAPFVLLLLHFISKTLSHAHVISLQILRPKVLVAAGPWSYGCPFPKPRRPGIAACGHWISGHSHMQLVLHVVCFEVFSVMFAFAKCWCTWDIRYL